MGIPSLCSASVKNFCLNVLRYILSPPAGEAPMMLFEMPFTKRGSTRLKYFTAGNRIVELDVSPLVQNVPNTAIIRVCLFLV